jgi:hypothetical protein
MLINQLGGYIYCINSHILVCLIGTRRVPESSSINDKCLNLKDLIQLHLEEKKPS